MERQHQGVAPRRSRFLAASVLLAALVVGWIVVQQGLRHKEVIGLPTVIGGIPSADLPADIDFRTIRNGKLLAALATAGRAGSSVVDVRAGARHGAGFIAWAGLRHSYVLVPQPVVASLLAKGKRDLEIAVGDVVYPARLLDASTGRQLALVRVRGNIGRGLLSIRPGEAEPGRVAVTVSWHNGHKRVQALNLRLTPEGVLLARGYRRIPIGSPVLLLNGHVGGIAVRGGKDAIVLPLGRCLTRERCFGPTLP